MASWGGKCLVGKSLLTPRRDLFTCDGDDWLDSRQVCTVKKCNDRSTFYVFQGVRKWKAWAAMSNQVASPGCNMRHHLTNFFIQATYLWRESKGEDATHSPFTQTIKSVDKRDKQAVTYSHISALGCNIQIYSIFLLQHIWFWDIVQKYCYYLSLNDLSIMLHLHVNRYIWLWLLFSCSNLRILDWNV